MISMLQRVSRNAVAMLVIVTVIAAFYTPPADAQDYRYRAQGVAIAALATRSAAPAVSAAQTAEPKTTGQTPHYLLHVSAGGLQRRRFGKQLRVRGWRVGQRVYVGQTKVGGSWGIGVVVDRGAYRYGINNRGVSLEYRL